MKKKFLSSLLFAALVGGVTSTFTACKDYDDDINNLQKQIDANSEAIKKIQDLIKSGSVITSVDDIANGVRVTLSDGKYFDITNGNDGKNGTAWTISEDGYWVKDGDKTSYKAIGEKGDKGDKGDQGDKGDKGDQGDKGDKGDQGDAGSDGKYYVPNPQTGNFDIVDADGNHTDSGISYLGTGAVTATMDNENLTLIGVSGTKDPVVISLTADLRSLVFMPKLYLDGIETVQYPWIHTTSLDKKVTDGIGTNHQGKTVKELVDYQAVNPVVCNYGPTWPVDYHMNPSNSNVKSDDVVGFNSLESTVIYTRAAGATVNYSDEIFQNKDGILTVGMQVTNPQDLVSQPTKEQNQKDQTIALQVKSKASMNSKGVITSDYALIRPMKTTVEGLVWVEKPMYGVQDPTKRTELGDEACAFEPSKGKVHVWDTPQEALKDARGAALELYYNSEEGINISNYLGIHYRQENVDPNITLLNEGTWNFGEEKAYGLSYEFNLVYYTVDGNKTVDSKYAKWVKDGQAEGKLRAWNVKFDGDQYPEEGATSESTIDREPLVQVLVKNGCGEVILDGYILVHITREAPAEADNKIITKWDALKTVTTFDLCNVADARNTTWAQFSDFVLTQEMENMTKEEFDAQYEIDGTKTGTAADGGDVYTLNVYATAPVRGDIVTATTAMGTVEYLLNTQGTTNHTFKWTVDETLLESWTHDAATLPVNKTIYVRYKAIAGAGAKYPYIYISLTQDFARKAIAKTAFGDKNDNYWYGLDGKDAGWEAIVFDVNEPIDGGDINTINHQINSTLLKNQPKSAGKYYFVPEAYEITAQNGTVYTVTPQSSATDAVYGQLICKYITTPAADVHQFDKSTLDEILNKCAIDDAKGAFVNNALYAKNNATNVYTKIATLNQTTGEIELVYNDVTKDVLNAIGYAENHANINTEMRAMLGFVTTSQCGIADQVEDGIFTASWQRPINMKKFDNKVAVDAKTNGNIIYVLDFLKLFDWRGEQVGYMWNDQQWFWAYYGVKAITVDVTPSKVLTNMHSGTFKPLNEITTAARLFTYPAMTQSAKEYQFDLRSWNSDDYDFASMNPALLAAMEANKDMFGAIYYENNGDNVTKFSVRVPITVEYTWGKFMDYVEIEIDRTAGN